MACLSRFGFQVVAALAGIWLFATADYYASMWAFSAGFFVEMSERYKALLESALEGWRELLDSHDRLLSELGTANKMIRDLSVRVGGRR